MTSRYRVFGLRFALGASLLASACQPDSNAEFDDRNLTSPDVGGSANNGGSGAAAGENPAAGSEAGGSDASGGSASQGGNASAGAAGSGSSAAGKGGTASAGGKGGTGTGGTTGQAGKGSQGGAAGTASGGMAGSANPPEPITLETADIDDTYVASCMQQLNFGEAKLIMVDGGAACRYDTLIDFPRLELPAGALVSEATLTLTCTNAGDAITVSYADEAWKELTVRWSTRPEVGATIGTITCAEVGEVTIDLTAAFEAWQAGDHAANGIYLRTEETNGTDFGSSEAEKLAARPQLSITYTLPVK